LPIKKKMRMQMEEAVRIIKQETLAELLTMRVQMEDTIRKANAEVLEVRELLLASQQAKSARKKAWRKAWMHTEEENRLHTRMVSPHAPTYC
jgi:hypothetical protein